MTCGTGLKRSSLQPLSPSSLCGVRLPLFGFGDEMGAGDLFATARSVQSKEER